MLRQPKKVQTIVASASRLTSSNSGAVQLTDFDFDSLTFKLNVTVASGSAPTLDVYIQTSDDGGSTWKDSARFAQVAAATTNPHYASVPASVGAGVVHGAIGDATISASTVGVPLLDRIVRAKWVIAAASAFTFQIDAIYNNEGRGNA